MKNAILPLVLALLAACSDSSKEAPAPSGPVAALPASMKLDAAPASPQGVVEVRQSAADGAEVVLTGKVRDFMADRAVFTIADLSLRSCAEPGDPMADCKTPWDYCCEDPAKRTAGTATVEVREGAEVAKGTARGWNGLDHLKTVTVRGKVAKDAQGNVTVIASGIHVGS